MRILNVRNVHEALPLALDLLRREGIERPSRNGPVLQGPSVATVYAKPMERVLFWPERDANPFYHLYESLWMLAGRNDVEPLKRYAKNAGNYSDDGKTWYGAYGHRWRHHFGTFGKLESGIGDYEEWQKIDQLKLIAAALKANPEDRRCMLQMWDARADLGKTGKDFPCNTIASFQRSPDGALHLTVFCRSNDIIWGAYGANAVQFSFLLEYMALWIGCPVGTYTQISVNWHAYLDTYKPLEGLGLFDATAHGDPAENYVLVAGNPYGEGTAQAAQMFHCGIEEADARIKSLLFHADTDFIHERQFNDDEPFFNVATSMLIAHMMYKRQSGFDKFAGALTVLGVADQRNDWIRAGTEWMLRREKAYRHKYNAAGQVINRTDVNAAGQQHNMHYRPEITNGNNKLEE